MKFVKTVHVYLYKGEKLYFIPMSITDRKVAGFGLSHEPVFSIDLNEDDNLIRENIEKAFKYSEDNIPLDKYTHIEPKDFSPVKTWNTFEKHTKQLVLENDGDIIRCIPYKKVRPKGNQRIKDVSLVLGKDASTLKELINKAFNIIDEQSKE